MLIRSVITGACLLLLPTLGQAKQVKVHVKNCMDVKVIACSYNGKDSSRISEFQKKIVAKNGTTTLKCKGQGKNRCKVSLRRDIYGNQDCKTEKKLALKDGHWVKLWWDATERKVKKSEHSSKPSC